MQVDINLNPIDDIEPDEVKHKSISEQPSEPAGVVEHIGVNETAETRH